MTFHVGDPIMHWVHGLGEIVALEEHIFSDAKKLYYGVKIRDMTVWVPLDDEVNYHLRPPTAADEFNTLITILGQPGETLSDDRQERKLQILEKLKDGRAESLCRVISGLSTYQQIRSLNETDQNLMKRAKNALLGEWVHVLPVTLIEAETELRRLLNSGQLQVQGKV